MTFTEIVDTVSRDMNLRGTEALTRIGISVNRRYKRIKRALGMNVYTRVEVGVTLAAGTQDQIYDMDDPLIARIVAIFWTPTATSTDPNPRPVMIDEVTYEEMKEITPTTDRPRRWAKVRVSANSTQFKVDTVAGGDVLIEGEETPTELESDMEPEFDEMFHEMLVIGAEADEYGRQKTADARARAKDLEAEFETNMGELRLKQTLMAGGVIKQGKHANYRNPLARRGYPYTGQSN